MGGRHWKRYAALVVVGVAIVLIAGLLPDDGDDVAAPRAPSGPSPSLRPAPSAGPSSAAAGPSSVVVPAAFESSAGAGATAGPAAVPGRLPAGEVVDRRTETSRTVRNVDGTYTLESFISPVHYRGADGAWRPIDNTLVASGRPGYAWQNKANRFSVHLKDNLGSEAPVALELGGETYTLAPLELGTARGSRNSAKAHYPKATRATDIDYQVTETGLKETIVLHGPDAPSRFRFRFQGPAGTEVIPQEGGSLEVRDGEGRPVFSFAAPWAEEAASPAFSPDAPHASLAVSPVPDGHELTLTVEEPWLRAPGRRFPILVDPTITIQPAYSAAVESWASTSCKSVCRAHGDRLNVGSTATATYRSMVKFDLTSVPLRAAVSNAQLTLIPVGCFDNTCDTAAHQLHVHRVTNGPWFNRDPGWDYADSSYDPAVSATVATQYGWNTWTWNTTSLAQSWVNSDLPNWGMVVKESNETLGRYGWCMASSDWADAAARPKFVVTYTDNTTVPLPPRRHWGPTQVGPRMTTTTPLLPASPTPSLLRTADGVLLMFPNGSCAPSVAVRPYQSWTIPPAASCSPIVDAFLPANSDTLYTIQNGVGLGAPPTMKRWARNNATSPPTWVVDRETVFDAATTLGALRSVVRTASGRIWIAHSKATKVTLTKSDNDGVSFSSVLDQVSLPVDGPAQLVVLGNTAGLVMLSGGQLSWRSEADNWSSAAAFSETLGAGASSDAVVDDQGGVHVVYSAAGLGIRHRLRDASGTWTPPLSSPGTTVSATVGPPSVSSDGSALTVLATDGARNLTRWSWTGAWSAPTPVMSGGRTKVTAALAPRVAPGGVTPMVWDESELCGANLGDPACERYLLFDYVDTVAPVGSMTSPHEGEVMFATQTVQVAGSDDGGIQQLDFYVDRGDGRVSYLASDADPANGFSYAWDVKALDGSGKRIWPDGAYRVFAVPWDYRANRGETDHPLAYIQVRDLGVHDARPTIPVPLAGGMAGVINLATGALTLTQGDVSVPTVIGPLGVSRTYTSQDATDDKVGSGWALSVDVDVDLVFRKLIDHASDPDYPSGTLELVEADGTRHFYFSDGKDTFSAYLEDSSRLARNNDGTWTLSLIDGSRYDFRPDGQPATITPPATGEKRFISTYDPITGALTAVAEPTGRSVSLEYLGGRLSKLHDIDPNRTWSYAYTGSDLTSVTTPANQLTSFGYDAAHRMTSVTDPGGQVTYFDYDATGRVSQVRRRHNGGDFTTSIDYATAMAPKVTGYRGNLVGCDAACKSFYTTTYATDAARRLVRVDKKLPSGATVSKTTGWDEVAGLAGAPRPRNLKTSESDFRGNVTRYVYDEVGNLIRSTDPAGNAAQLRYDEGYTGLVGEYYPNRTFTPTAGLPKRRLDQGINFSYADCPTPGTCSPDPAIPADGYSARWSGYVKAPTTGSYTFSTTSDDGVRVSVDGRLVIDRWNDHTATTDTSAPLTLAAGAHEIGVQYYEATGPSRLALSWSGPGIATQVVPAANLAPGLGLVTSSVDPSGQTTTTTYDDPFRRHLVAQSATNTDLDGAQTTLKTTYEYTDPATGVLDAYGRLRRKTLPNGNTGASPDPRYATTYAYYPDGATATDPCTAAVANQGGLGQSETFGNEDLIAPVTHVYDERGNEVAGTDGLGTTCVGYDAANRPLSTKAPDRAAATSSTYDANGNRTQVTDPVVGTSTYAYDDLNRLTSATDVYGGAATTYTYDTFSAATMTTTRNDPAGRVDQIGDQLGRMTSLQFTPAGGSAQTYGFTYDANDDLDVTTYPNGATADRDVDTLGRLVALRNHNAAGGVIADYTDTYDANSRKTVEDGPQGQWRYRYDPAGRLEQVNDPAGLLRRYRYDRNTNRLRKDTAAGLNWSRGTTVLDTTPGTPVTFVDPNNGSTQITLPFAVPFYGQTLTSLWVTPNGYLTTASSGAPQPNLATTKGVFPFAKDLKVGTGAVTTKADPPINPTRFLIRWKVQSPTASATDLTHYDDFGVWLYPDGHMTYMYGQMDDPAAARVAYSKGDGVQFTTVAGLDQATIPPNAPSVELTAQAGTTAGPYTYDARDRLNPDANHTFDRAGNSTRIAAATYTYDGRSLLTSTTVATRASTFTYDGEGREVKTTVDGAERRLRYGAPGDSTATYETDTTGAVTRFHLAGPGGLLAHYTGTTATYYVLTPRGDIAATTNPAGIVTTTPTFDEYGAPALTNLPNTYGFLGRHQKETDPASGLTVMGARAYDPQHGRFLQRDPIEGGCANDYVYVSGDPINDQDLDGNSKRTVRTGCKKGQHVYVDVFTAGLGGTAVLNAKLKIGKNTAWRRVAPVLGTTPRRGVRGGFKLDSAVGLQDFWIFNPNSNQTITHIQLATSRFNAIVLTVFCIPAGAGPDLII